MNTTSTRPPWAVSTTAHHITYAPGGETAGLRGHEARRFRAATAERTAERRGDLRAAAAYMSDRHAARDALVRAAWAAGVTA